MLLVSMLASLFSHAGATQELDYFRGKTINYIVASKPGGGYDIYARLIASFMEKYLPETKIRIKNVPGAGGLVAVNRLNVSAPNGLTISTFNTGVVYSQLLEREGVNFDLGDLSWIGKATSTTRVLVLSARSGFESLAHMRGAGEPALFSTSGVGSASYIETILVTQLLGINSRIVPGYSGNDSQLAMMRGEIDGAIASLSAIREFTESGHARMLLVVSGDAALPPGVPFASALVDTAQATSAFQLIDTIAGLGRLTAAPPGVPAGRLEVLRDAYRMALQDPGFLSQAAALQLHIAPAFGDAVAQAFDMVLSNAGEKRALLTSLVEDKAAPER